MGGKVEDPKPVCTYGKIQAVSPTTNETTHLSQVLASKRGYAWLGTLTGPLRHSLSEQGKGESRGAQEGGRAGGRSGGWVRGKHTISKNTPEPGSRHDHAHATHAQSKKCKKQTKHPISPKTHSYNTQKDHTSDKERQKLTVAGILANNGGYTTA
jgi:hypothetical protein